jgi:hypothetical protein
VGSAAESSAFPENPRWARAKDGLQLALDHTEEFFAERSFCLGGLPPSPRLRRAKGKPPLLGSWESEKFIDENKIPFQIVGHMSISKDTLKAIIIIVISLAVLVVLLVVANHLRPHP